MFGWGKKTRIAIDGWSYPVDPKVAEFIAGLHSTVRGRTDLFYRANDHIDSLQEALRTIADMETPSANATVKRMAKVAREAL